MRRGQGTLRFRRSLVPRVSEKEADLSGISEEVLLLTSNFGNWHTILQTLFFSNRNPLTSVPKWDKLKFMNSSEKQKTHNLGDKDEEKLSPPCNHNYSTSFLQREPESSEL
jgi:hypothetical protein